MFKLFSLCAILLFIIFLVIYIIRIIRKVNEEKIWTGYNDIKNREFYPPDFDFTFPFWKRFWSRFWFGLFGELKLIKWIIFAYFLVYAALLCLGAYIIYHFINKWW
jgi:hypothetical protein